MPCTTILVGKKASYDGSTMIARNDDSPSGQFTPKKFVVVHPEEQPKKYESVLSHVEIDLPEDPMRYTAVPNALDGEGIWAAHGVNAAGVGMTATETITSNARVLGADPLVEYVPAKDGVEEISGGIGEEDIVSLVLPYIHSAREGVTRLGSLLEKYGTYEMNGIAFSDKNEIWWLETIGGHHWIARRVPDVLLQLAFQLQRAFLCKRFFQRLVHRRSVRRILPIGKAARIHFKVGFLYLFFGIFFLIGKIIIPQQFILPWFHDSFTSSKKNFSFSQKTVPIYTTFFSY